MKNVRNVCLWVAYGCVSLIKLPFSILSFIFTTVETSISYLNVGILSGIGSEDAIDILNTGANFNIKKFEAVAEFWEDVKEEL